MSKQLISLTREQEVVISSVSSDEFSKALNDQERLITARSIIPLFPAFHGTVPIYLVKIMASSARGNYSATSSTR